jgi:hypothetical protein
LGRQRLAKGGEIARGVVRELILASIWLQRDPSGKYCWTCFADGVRIARLDQQDITERSPILEDSACVVAGAGFPLA